MGMFSKKEFWPENKLKSRLTNYYLTINLVISFVAFLALVLVSVHFENQLTESLLNKNNAGMVMDAIPLLESSFRIFALIVGLYILTASGLSILVTQIFVEKIHSPIQDVRKLVKKLTQGEYGEQINETGYQVFQDMIREANRLSKSLDAKKKS